MPHALKMKDGKLLTPFGIRDLLDAVEDYAGEELRREIEEYIETNVEDIDDYEKSMTAWNGMVNALLTISGRFSVTSGTRWTHWTHSCRIRG